MSQSDHAQTGKPAAEKAVMGILWALSQSHLLNDAIQSLIPAIYPVLKTSYGFSYAQIGLITSESSPGSQEKRWVDGVLACKKGLGL